MKTSTVQFRNETRVVNLCNAEELKENKCLFANRGVIIENGEVVSFVNEKNPEPLKDGQQYGLLTLKDRAETQRWYSKAEFNLQDAINQLAEQGYKVSEEAILHNYKAWEEDLKSGFICGDIFIFSPCGCNPLSFRAEEFTGESYQGTYEA